MTFQGAFSLGRINVVEAIETKCFLAECGLGDFITGPEALLRLRDGTGEVATVCIASDHLETVWKGRDFFGWAPIGVEKVVSKHTADLIDDCSGTIVVHEVKCRSPIS